MGVNATLNFEKNLSVGIAIILAMPTDVCGTCSIRFYTKQQLLRCSGSCNRRFHCKCIDVGQDEYDLLMQSGRSTYKCSDCIRRRGSSSTVLLNHDDDGRDEESASETEESTHDAAAGSEAVTERDFVRLLSKISSKLDVLTAEVK